jgi:hypothetical protein
MEVNGLKLPDSYLRFLAEEPGAIWYLKENVDAYGNPLQTDFDPFETVERMEQNTAELAEGFSVEDWKPEWIEERAKEPGFIPFIDDFSQIVQFGRHLTGAPFCFDFRENSLEPGVIYWDDGGSY